MLSIYGVMLDVLRWMKDVMRAIEKRDVDLAKQLRRASSSVVLNIAEGSGSCGGTRRARYVTALGSARETRACFDVAVAMGYIDTIDDQMLRKLDIVIGTLVRLV